MKRGAEGTSPSTNGGNGGDHDAHGRFAKGNSGGPGNPHIKAVAAWRSALVRVVTPKDIEAVIKQLVVAAKAGNPWAVRELLDRCLGKPHPSVESRRAGTEGPPSTVQIVNVDLGKQLTARMIRLSEQPSSPGLPGLRDLPGPAVGGVGSAGDGARGLPPPSGGPGGDGD